MSHPVDPQSDSSIVSEPPALQAVGPAERRRITGRVGDCLVAAGVITEAQLQQALVVQRSREHYAPIGQILVDEKLVTRDQLTRVMEKEAKRLRLGEVLLRSGAISQAQLDHAVQQQTRLKMPLGQALVQLGFISDDAMRQALSMQLNIPYLDLYQIVVNPELSKLVSAAYARRHNLVPVSLVGNCLTIAMDDPTHSGVLEELSQATTRRISVVTAAQTAIEHLQKKLYGGAGAATSGVPGPDVADQADALDIITEEERPFDASSKYVESQLQDQQAVRIVRQIVRHALARGSSDVHLEIRSEDVRLRFRTDGILQESNCGVTADVLQRNARRLISRIKILAKLDISERRRPQDGSFRVTAERNGARVNVDFRVSVIPGYYGESVVLRVLDRRRAPQSIEGLGFSPELSDRFARLLKRPNGIFLVTGPTGSGKSTTLYAALMSVHKPQIRILTAEDPIEYVYDEFSQSEVNEAIGNTFNHLLRSFLRHDPEVIMLGEIRDEETAQTAFRAAQTGHLVLSTLHTNSAITAVSRLLDLAVEPNLVASSLIGVLSQRLVREVCTRCKEPYTPSFDIIREFFGTPPVLTWVRGSGCVACNFTGYKGRMAAAELWVPSDRDIILINKGAPFEEIQSSAAESTIPMVADVHARLVAGRTNLEELIRVLPYDSVRRFREAWAAGEGPETRVAV